MKNDRLTSLLFAIIILLLFIKCSHGKSSGGSRGGSSGGSRSSGRSGSYSSGGGGGGGSFGAWWDYIAILLCIFGTIAVLYYFWEKYCKETILEDGSSVPLNQPDYLSIPNEKAWPDNFPMHPLPPSQRGDTGFRSHPNAKGPALQYSGNDINMPPPAYEFVNT